MTTGMFICVRGRRSSNRRICDICDVTVRPGCEFEWRDRVVDLCWACRQRYTQGDQRFRTWADKVIERHLSTG